MLRLYLDEHQSRSLARALRARSIDVQTAVEAGLANHQVPDPVQLAWAATHGRVFVTGDWDFLIYGATVHPHAGVIIVPRRVAIGVAIQYLEFLAKGYEPAEVQNQIIVFPSI